ncbi:unnamed protein product, partial [Meganyctiphanes norvegica]
MEEGLLRFKFGPIESENHESPYNVTSTADLPKKNSNNRNDTIFKEMVAVKSLVQKMFIQNLIYKLIEIQKNTIAVLYISEYNELTDKLHRFEAKEQEILEQLSLSSPPPAPTKTNGCHHHGEVLQDPPTLASSYLLYQGDADVSQLEAQHTPLSSEACIF